MARARRNPIAAAPRRAPRAAAPLPSDPAALADLVKAYIGFTAADSRLLRSFYPEVEPHVPRIVEDFYARIEADPFARKVITGGEAQIGRLKETLRLWLERTVKGPHDEEFARLQAAVGSRHVKIGLDQSYMVTGMHVFREHLNRILVLHHARRTSRSVATQRAFVRVLDLSLALMLETFRVDWHEKMLRLEQNATFQRLAAMGELVAVIAHEIRNPLAAISGAVQVLGEDLKPADPRREIFKEVLDQIARLDGRVNELLVYARPAAPARELVHPVALLRTTARLLAGDPLTREVKLRVSGARDLSAFPLDAGQIQQVLVNLVQNSLQAMKGKGEVRLTARRMDGGGIEIVVEDDGPGIPDGMTEEIFKPFLTTRPGGTGLGLAISRKIAESHGGSLTVERGRRGGARFVLSLPVPAEEPSPHAPLSLQAQ